VVHQADETRCINIRNCVYACPFGVPKFDTAGHYMRKCNLCYDRTSLGKGPMCATVCPTQAIFYGTYEEWLAAGRAEQGAKPVNVFFFGKQRVRTRNYIVMTEHDEALDLMELAEAASYGHIADMPVPTLGEETEQWVEADAAGIPEREAPPQPWTPRTPPEVPPKPGAEPHHQQPEPNEVPMSPSPGVEPANAPA
jgi:hypothetical protein